MFDPKDPWTTALAIVVSLMAVKIGIQNLEWALKTAGDVVIQMETRFNK